MIDNMTCCDKKFHLFGDESHFGGAIVYAIVIVPARIRPQVEDSIRSIKSNFGLSPNEKIHCREILNEIAKKKTSLKQLDKSTIFKLLDALLQACKKQDVRMWVGYLKSKTAPDGLMFEAQHKSKNINKNWDIRDIKIRMNFAYHAAMSPVLHCLHQDNCEAWVDGDTTKIAQITQSVQANTAKKLFPIDHNDKQFIPTPVTADKPVFIEIADILAYTAAHHLSSTITKDKCHYDSMLDGSIGYSEVVFDERTQGPIFSIRVPNNHIAALKAYALRSGI